MMPKSTSSSTATSIDATRRKLIVGIVITTLMALAIVIADLASGGRPDPPTLRAAATLLDGSWRFHTGDDSHWADANTDDSGWETVDMTALPGSHDGDVGLPDYVGGWMAHGHPSYHGYAWYRRAVTVPAGRASWDILGPTLVQDGYELYWNGQRLGGSGRLGPAPRVVGTRPLRFALPADAAGTRGVLAVRTYMLPSSGVSADGGGMHSAPILAPRPISDALHRVQWERTIAGYIVDVIEPIAMLALIGLALGCRSCSSHGCRPHRREGRTAAAACRQRAGLGRACPTRLDVGRSNRARSRPGRGSARGCCTTRVRPAPAPRAGTRRSRESWDDRAPSTRLRNRADPRRRRGCPARRSYRAVSQPLSSVLASAWCESSPV